jgi:hypothetical protein
MKFGLVFLILISLSESLLASPQTYLLTDAAKTIEQCQQLRANLVERFPMAARSKVLSSSCEKSFSNSYNVLIEYVGMASTLLVSNYDEGADVHGLYATREECEAGVEAAVSEFQQLTSIDPFVAYCFRDLRREGVDKYFTLRIDGFGKATLKPYTFARHFYDASQLNTDVAAQNFSAVLAAFGAQGVGVKFYTDAQNTSFMVSYYAAQKLPLSIYSDAFLPSEVACESYRPVMNDVYSRASGRLATYFCAGSRESQTRRIISVGLTTEPLASELATVKYGTYQDCDQGRAALEESFQNSLGLNVVGSVCGVEWLSSPTEFVTRIFWVN